MSQSRKIILAFACGLLVALGAGIGLPWLAKRSRLPALVAYPGLPAPFSRALATARDKALAGVSSTDDVRGLAQLYQANRLFTEARACYQVIAAKPGGLSARDHYYLAAMAQDEDALDKAVSELRQTLLLDPSYSPARLELADALFKEGQADEAAKEYASILAGEPGQPQASFGMARIEIQRGDDDGAVARLRDLIALHPDSTSGAALLAQVLERRKDTDGAEAMRELSRQTHEPAPADPWMRVMLADCYDREKLGMKFEEYRLDGQMNEALPLLSRLEELDPNGWIPPMLHGWSEKEAGHYEESARQYRLALQRGGDPERICPLLAAVLLLDKKTGEAAALLADYHARLPHSLSILRSYSEVAVRMNDEKLARSLLTEVLRADPYLYMPNMSMVQILWTSGEHDAAAECLQRVARVFPNDVDSRGMLGQYYMEKADPWSAAAPLERALAVSPLQDPRRARIMRMLNTAYLSAGSLEASHGKYPRAIEFSEKSIALVPGGMSGYALKANVLLRTKDFRGAADAFLRMSAIDPAEPTLELRLGDALYQAGDRDGANAHWRRALQLAPASPPELRSALALRLSGQVSPSTFE
jgi:tetratricopeptide (TPR) repeat protein